MFKDKDSAVTKHWRPRRTKFLLWIWWAPNGGHQWWAPWWAPWYGGRPELDSSPTLLLLIHKLIPSHILPARNWPNFKMETIALFPHDMSPVSRVPLTSRAWSVLPGISRFAQLVATTHLRECFISTTLFLSRGMSVHLFKKLTLAPRP